MRKVVGAVVAVAVVLAFAVVAGLQSGTASGQPSKAKVAANIKVPIAAKTYTLTAGGRKRTYEVIAPVKTPPASAPIIVFLSGIGASVASEVSRDDLVPYVTSDQAELVYPVGYDKSWNAITCCGDAATNVSVQLRYCTGGSVYRVIFVALTQVGGVHRAQLRVAI